MDEKLFNNSKVLVVAPHFDDEVIGSGGTLLKNRNKMSELIVVHLTKDERRLEEFEEVKKAIKVDKHFSLNFADGFLSENYKECVVELINIIQTIKPEIILVPHRQDNHVDHIAANLITSDAVNKSRYWNGLSEFSGHKVNFMLEYEVWHPQSDVSLVVNITEEFSNKIEMMSMYKSQLDFPYLKYIDSCNTWRGLIHFKKGQAEAFRLISL